MKKLNNGILKGGLDYMRGEISDEELYAESYARQMWGEYYDNEYIEWMGNGLTYGEVCKNDFLAGVEYQKQQMYTEEPKQDFYKIGNFHELCDDSCKYHCTKGNTQLADCLSETKKETLEDVTKNAVLNSSDMRASCSMGKFGEEMFKLGAKWKQEQSEKMYTEEVYNIAKNAFELHRNNILDDEELEEEFERVIKLWLKKK